MRYKSFRQKLQNDTTIPEEAHMNSGTLKFYAGVDALLIFVFPLTFMIFNCIYWYFYMGVHGTDSHQ